MEGQENILDEEDDIWMIQDEPIIWENEHNDVWMLELEDNIMDFIRSIILDIIDKITV